MQGTTLIVREPIGVVGLITPWNWPINQIVCKVAPAIAAGCTMVLKPSEIAPLNAIIWSEVMHAAGVPAGVYNMVQGDGAVVGAGDVGASRYRHDVVHRFDPRRHPGRPGRGDDGQARRPGTRRQVGQHPACRTSISPAAVTRGVLGMMGNSGQSCNAPTRMFVPRRPP